jgi:predicted metal-dependent hydrolase
MARDGAYGTVEVDGFVVSVIRKRIKNLRLAVHPPDGQITLSVPVAARREDILTFLESKLSWMRDKTAIMAQRPRPAPVLFTGGEIHYLWGRPCVLRVEESAGRPSAVFGEGTILLRVPPGCGPALRENIMHAGYGGLLMEAVRPLAARTEAVLGAAEARFFPRRMKSRWGSCSPHNRRIRLNTQLAAYPPNLLEYVLVHEMVHLLEPGHNRRFYSLVEGVLPDWRTARATLRTLSLRQA